jgi:hypothetical protein
MTTTATHLRTCAMHWTDLRDALGQPAIHHGFGIGLRGHLAALDEPLLELLAQARADERADSSPDALGTRPVPLRIHILDTMRTVETDLIACADTIARQAQRDPMASPSARSAAYGSQREADIAHADRLRRTQLAHADLVDPKRWRWTGTRTAPHAALWLLARVERAPGPCRRITDDEEHHIGTVAATAAGRVEQALDIAAQRKTLEQLHECGGRIDVHGGAGAQPLAHCTRCGRVWAEGVIAA